MALVEHELMEDTSSRLSEAMPGDFLELLKPRVMSLVVFTAFVGMAVAPVTPHPLLAVIAVLAIAVGAGASGALNMWYDADIDAVMSRTAKRPVPSGRVTPREALAFGLVLSVLSVLTLALLANLLSAALLAFTIFFYAVIYTMWLKRSTPQNIVIGGAAGALPPVVGWAAVTNTVTIEPIVLFAIIFLWTPPHFWALALFKRGDYERAGVPMLPNVAGDANTRLQIFIYSLLVAVSGVLPTILGFASLFYGAVSAALGICFIWYAWKVWQNAGRDEKLTAEKQLFGFSLLYLFAVFAVLLVDSFVLKIWG